jgi:hypothetical protein
MQGGIQVIPLTRNVHPLAAHATDPYTPFVEVIDPILLHLPFLDVLLIRSKPLL